MTEQLSKVRVRREGMENYEDFLRGMAGGRYTFVDASSHFVYVFENEEDAVGFSIRFDDMAWIPSTLQVNQVNQVISNQLQSGQQLHSSWSQQQSINPYQSHTSGNGQQAVGIYSNPVWHGYGS